MKEKGEKENLREWIEGNREGEKFVLNCFIDHNYFLLIKYTTFIYTLKMKFFLCFTFYLFAYTQINNCVAQVRRPGSKIKKMTHGSDSFTANMPFMAHEIVYKRKSTGVVPGEGWRKFKAGQKREGVERRIEKKGLRRERWTCRERKG